MNRRRWLLGLIGAGMVFSAFVLPAYAFIERLLPLQALIDDSDYVFVGEIEKVDPTKPGMIVTWQKDLKDKTPFKRLPINLTGDKEKHTPALLKRVAPQVPVVVFITDNENQQLGLMYTNGTWFQVLGTRDGEQIRWAFTHCEIYLRRTYKESTSELAQLVADVVAQKKKAPKPDPKEPAGLGPEIKKAG